jgi:hypothetical protein
MTARSASSQADDPSQAALEIKKALGDLEPTVVMAFASSAYDQPALARALHAQFPRAVVAGCSTSGELAGARMYKRSVAALGLDKSLVARAWATTAPGSNAPDVDAALASLETQSGQKMRDLRYDRHVGLVMTDGVGGGEERVMDRLGDRASIRFVGGSSGDDLQFKRTWVHANGNAVTGTGLVLLEPAVPFTILKTQSARPQGRQLVPTRVTEGRLVHEFNGEPAVAAYAAAIGCRVEDVATQFGKHPVGLMVDGEPYIRSCQRIVGNALLFYCAVQEGTPLQLLEAGDIVADTKRALVDHEKANGPIAALLNFHCILRTLQLEAHQQTDAYGALFHAWPSAGFSTYGEQYAGHINQTSTMLVLHEKHDQR